MAAILKASGIDQAPDRSEITWSQFLHTQAAGACDYFCVDSALLRRFYVLFFIHIERHEAFLDPAVVKGHRYWPVAAGRFEAEGSLTRGTPGRVASSPDNDGTCQHRQMVWARQARRKGATTVNQRSNAPQVKDQLEPDGSGLGCGAYPPDDVGWGTLGLVDVAGREAMVNACGVAVARPQGQSWAPTPSRVQE